MLSDKQKEYFKAYREENKIRIREKSNEYYKKNKKRIQEKRRQNPSKEKDSDLRSVFGITFLEYTVILKSQNGVCAICKKNEIAIDPRTGKVRGLAVDHCHASSKVRGLLCSKCNRSLGGLNDSIELLKEAISYLEKSK